MNKRILIVPGWMDSEPSHWQSIWERRLRASRVSQKDWNTPRRSDWIQQLASQVKTQTAPPVLVAHSLGANTAVALVAETEVSVAGLFLVAPADLELPSTPQEIRGFLPIPMQRLLVPSLLITSDNDPYCSRARAQQFAQAWGSEWVSLGERGHINVAAGFGDWEDGMKLLEQWSSRLSDGLRG